MSIINTYIYLYLYVYIYGAAHLISTYITVEGSSCLSMKRQNDDRHAYLICRFAQYRILKRTRYNQ